MLGPLFVLFLVSFGKTNFPGKFETRDSSSLPSTRYDLEVAEYGLEGSRLDSHLAAKLNQHTRSFLGSLCDDGFVSVNGKVRNKSYRVKFGDRISMSFVDKKASSVEPEDLPLDILYEDDDIIAVNKPSGMVVHPAVGSPNGTFVNALLHHVGSDASRCLFEDAINKQRLKQTTPLR